MLDSWQKLRKIIAMLHEIISITFAVSAVAMVLAFIVAEKRNSVEITNAGIALFALTILSTVGAFFTL